MRPPTPEKGGTLHAAVSPGEVRLAATSREGLLLDYVIWRPGAPEGIGDLHLGRVSGLTPALGGVFVALADGEGFLPFKAGGKNLSVGERLVVRITRAAQNGKGPRLAREPLPPPEGPLRRLAEGPSPLLVLLERHQPERIRCDDSALLATLPSPWRERAERVGDVFTGALADEIAALHEPVHPLPGGAVAHVHPTPAFTAIDVDWPAPAGTRGEEKEAQRELNRALLPALARLIRLRNLGGAILIDFAGLRPKARAALAPALSAALAADPLSPRLLGFTALGFAEIVRPRLAAPLHERLAGPHAAALAGLAALWRASRSLPSAPPLLHLAPDAARALEADGFAQEEFLRLAGFRPEIRSAPDLPPSTFRLLPPSAESGPPGRPREGKGVSGSGVDDGGCRG
jgi:ribonuclease G